MIKINLEESLIRENRKLAIPKELLLINEYDKFTELVENDALSRVGLNNALKEGQTIKKNITDKKEQTKGYNQDRVFHISQIEGICKKYYLRFLPAEKYRGAIDSELPNRISAFEIAYNVTCGKWNTRIVAPLESFELQERPKDPLFFYKINDDYFYLIHKWGNDLNIFRAMLPLFSNGFFCHLIIPVLFTPLFFISIKLGAIVVMFASVISFAMRVGTWVTVEEPFTFIKKNEWDSPFK